MIRVAVIGASHVAALKMGWDRIAPDYPDAEITFFAAPGKAARAQTLRGMIYGYHSETPAPDEQVFGYDGGRTIDLSQFDHVLRTGYATQEEDLADLLSRFDVDGIAPAGRAQFLSEAAFTAFCAAQANRRVWPKAWHHWTNPSFTIAFKPYPDEACLNSASQHFDKWRALAAHPDTLLQARQVYLRAFTDVMAGHGINVVEQPAQTIAPSGLTLHSYSSGSMRMADGTAHDKTDYIHMNADYGALLLKAYLAKLAIPETCRAEPVL